MAVGGVVDTSKPTAKTDLKRKLVAQYSFALDGVELEGRGAIVKKYARPGLEVTLELDKTNIKKPFLVKVLIGEGMDIGYVKEVDGKSKAEVAKLISRFLHRGAEYDAKIQKIIEGKVPVPVITAKFYGHESAEFGQIDSVVNISRLKKFLYSAGGMLVLGALLIGVYVIFRRM